MPIRKTIIAISLVSALSACQFDGDDGAQGDVGITGSEGNQGVASESSIKNVRVEVVGRFSAVGSDIAGKSAAKIVPYHAANSIAIFEDTLAIAVEASDKTQNGAVLFYKLDNQGTGTFIKAVKVGALPDMVTFSPDGKKVLVANEGEPNSDYNIDPDAKRIDLLKAAGLKLAGPVGTTLAQSLEPEYITLSEESKTAFVSLQENNAIGIINLENSTIEIKPLGFKNWNDFQIDFTNKDEIASFKQVNGLYGMYQPEAIAVGTIGDNTYGFIASERSGDLFV